MLRQHWLYIAGLFISAFVASVIIFGLNRVEQQVRQHSINGLKTVLHSTRDTFSRIWLSNLYFDTSEVIYEQDTVKHIQSLLAIRHNRTKLIKHPSHRALIKHFKNQLPHLDSTGIDIIAPDYTTILSMNVNDTGKRNIIADHFPNKLARVFNGSNQFVSPIRDEHHANKDKHKNDNNAETIFYMIPVRTNENAIIAILAVRLNPYKTINKIAWNGRIGKTGETYLFDNQAYLITESRFQEQIQSDGYLSQVSNSSHSIVLRDPGANLTIGEKPKLQPGEQSLTYMAKSAIAGNSGQSKTGYRDYRGVPVLGVWLWDNDLGIGMATEIDEQEALEPYRHTQAIVLMMFAFALLSVLVFFYIIRLIRKQNQEEIEESEAYLSVVLENAADGIITIDDKGIIQTFNLAAEQLFQYSAREAIHQNIDIIVPAPYKAQHSIYIDKYKDTGHAKLIGNKTNLDGQRKDGSTFPVSIALSEIHLGEKSIFVAIVRDLTAEKQTQEKLESLVEERTNALFESEALNRQVLDSAAEGIYGLNAQGETIFVNPAAAAMLGYEQEELIGKPMHVTVHHSFVDGSHYPREDCPMYAAFSDGETHHVTDEVLWRKDGSSFPIEYTSTPIRNKGELVGAVVSFSDMTERLEVEETLRNINIQLEHRVDERTTELQKYSDKLRLSQNILNKAQQIAHLGSWDWDILSGDLTWSDEIYRIFGVEPQQFEATYDAFVEFIHPDDREMVTNAVNTSLNNRDTPYNIEHRILLPNGDIRYVREQGEIERDLDGEAIHMIGIVDDITDIRLSHNAIKQAMLDLAKNERVLRLALSGAGAGYWHLDLIAEELYWDELTLKMFGITAANFGGTFDDWAARVHEDDLENASKAFTQALEDKTANSFTLDYRIKKPNREIRYIHVTGHIDHNESGQAASVYGLHFDITEEKLAEQKLHDARENAELANRAKSEFLAVMSHEIRTPMNAIIGMSNLVMNTELAPRQHNYLKKVVSSAETLLQIINDILDFSKIEAGQLHLENVDFQLDEVLDKLTHLVVLKAQEKGLEFLFSVSPKIPPHLKGDPTRLLQVLVNLASNAVKFTDQGEVVLSVEVDEDQGKLVRIKFTVRDTGIGIEPQKQQHLFKSFSQADASITRKYGGTGLGLVIVKRMVKLMGGDIEFESEYGKGSSFYFTIPFGRSQSNQKTDHALPRDMENLRVLVVDDSESSRTILGETLEGFGFDVDVATGCNEAISAVETAEQRGSPYRLVLMDWKMPDQDGVEGARVILGQTKSPAPPVVMMVTAYNADDLADEIQNLAISSTLVKPVSPSSLLDAILNAFKQQELKHMDSSTPLYNPVNPAEELSGAHILVVEDNELNMELVVELLHDAGIKTASAGNGKQALKLLEQKKFDGVLMDVHMPVMDGLEATRTIRQQEKYQSLPIIALTADAFDADRDEFLAAGMNDVIVKPIKVDLMLETMAKWIRPASNNTLHNAVINSKDIEMNLSIPGIDTRAGLETCNGKLSLYQKLLKKFINEAEFIELFKDAMKKGDRDLAERLAHTLKGTAGNIGATGIQQAAKVLQDAFKENATDKMINQLYKKVEQELIPVIQALGKTEFEDKSASKVNADTLDITTLMPILDELGNLLADDDTDATEKIDQIYNDLKNSPFEDHINEIAKHVSRYEFKDALEQLHTLTARMKASN